jgi:hypothetical protein
MYFNYKDNEDNTKKQDSLQFIQFNKVVVILLVFFLFSGVLLLLF